MSLKKLRIGSDSVSGGEMIRSYYDSDKDILGGILQLHVVGGQFDLDPTYSRGLFWAGLPEPKLKSDLVSQVSGVIQADAQCLPFGSNSMSSICFDPPFMFGTHGQTKNNIMNRRFTMFDSWQELETMYQGSLGEFNRILSRKGILAFKCQDYTDSRTTMTHCYVWQWAMARGFYPKDLFIKLARGGRIYNPTLVQRHARKFHSYWWVFEKK